MAKKLRAVRKGQEKWSLYFDATDGIWVLEDHRHHSRSRKRFMCFLFLADAILCIERFTKQVDERRANRDAPAVVEGAG